MIVYKKCLLFVFILFVLYIFLDAVNRSIDAPPRPPPRHQSANRQNLRENPFNNMNTTMIQRAAPPPPPTSKTNPSNINTQGNAVCPHQFTHYSAQ